MARSQIPIHVYKNDWEIFFDDNFQALEVVHKDYSLGYYIKEYPSCCGIAMLFYVGTHHQSRGSGYGSIPTGKDGLALLKSMSQMVSNEDYWCSLRDDWGSDSAVHEVFTKSQFIMTDANKGESTYSPSGLASYDDAWQMVGPGPINANSGNKDVVYVRHNFLQEQFDEGYEDDWD